MMTEKSSAKLKSLFENLGKATQRGIRRCPQCRTPNGTRGLVCKNKLCGMVFKEKAAKKGHTPVGVRLVTGSLIRLFSVQHRIGRGGADAGYGFVQLPIVQDIEGNPTDNFDPTVLALTAKCHVESCRASRRFNTSGQTEPLCCVHVATAIDCSTDSEPLAINPIVVNSIAMPPDITESLQILLTEDTTAPLVQRIGTLEMVVRCLPDPKHPFGFLHFIISDKNQLHQMYRCACDSAKLSTAASQRCEHFYACVSAFASDVKLAREFQQLLGLVTLSPSVEDVQVTLVDSDSTMLPEVTSEEVHVPNRYSDVSSLVFFDNETIESNHQNAADDFVFVQETVNSAAVETCELVSLGCKGKRTKRPSTIETIVNESSETVDEGNVRVSFEEWLASVTERINQTMHYQFDGKPEPLVFNVPHKFFDVLQQRLSAGNQKKRLPNWMTGFQRKDALPLGTFTKCTWLINNIIHIKQIFDTAEVRLEITKSFIENHDGTFDVYEPPSPDIDAADMVHGRHPIRPSQIRTFLKVGKTSPDQEEPTPFIIEWIPNILANSQVGEMRIKFEFGHQRNGHAENREMATNSANSMLT